MPSEAKMKLIREKFPELENPPGLILNPATEGSSFLSWIEKFADRIEKASGGILTVAHGDGDGGGPPSLPGLPALTITRNDGGEIHYLALPEGPEEAPFFEALLGQAANVDGSGAGESLPQRLAALDRPAELLVFIASACPHCPDAVRIANSLALSSQKITTTIIDAQLFPGPAGRYGVKSVPLTMLDGELSIIGVRSFEEIAQRILERETGEHGLSILLSLIEQNRLAEAAELICSDGQAFFVTAWRKSTLSSRIALMLIAEEIIERNSPALETCISELIHSLHSEDDALRGDTADLLGCIGHPSSIGELKKLVDDPNPEVSEIAAEALEDIAQKNRGS